MTSGHPSSGWSSSHSVTDAEDLARRQGLHWQLVPIKEMVDAYLGSVELSGLSVRDDANRDGDIEIRSIGLRPGEKLYEELLIGNNPCDTSHPRIMMAAEGFLPWPELRARLDVLTRHVAERDVAATRRMLLDLVQEFAPTDGNVDWVHLARGKRARRLPQGRMIHAVH